MNPQPTLNPPEFWQPIAGFEGRYEVSSAGRVRSLDRKFGRNRLSGRILKLAVAHNRGGYITVPLWRDAKRHRAQVHRLVLEAFVGPCPDGMQCCHNNGDPADNRLENLRWGTLLENHADKLAHGTALLGEKNPKNKLTPRQVREIRASTDSLWKTARRYGVCDTTVHNIRVRKIWAHLP